MDLSASQYFAGSAYRGGCHQAGISEYGAVAGVCGHQPADKRRICRDDRAKCGSLCTAAYHGGLPAYYVPFKESTVAVAGQSVFPCATLAAVDHQYFSGLIKHRRFSSAVFLSQVEGFEFEGFLTFSNKS